MSSRLVWTSAGSRLRVELPDFGAEMREWSDFALSRRGSGDPARDRHAEAGHDVQHLAGDLGLGLLCRQSPGMKAAADHFLIPEHRHLRQRALSVIDRPLPSQPTALLNQLDVAVSLGRSGFGRAPRLIWAE